MRIRAPSTTSLLKTTLTTPPPPSLSNSCTSSVPITRCQGLDLLAMAMLEVERNEAAVVEEDAEMGRRPIAVEVEEEVVEKSGGTRKKEEEVEVGNELGVEKKRRRRQMAMPSRFQDSVLQPWKRRTRRHRSKGLLDESG